MAEKEITLEIKNPEIFVLLMFLSIIFVIELLVTFSTPISFGDEGFHTRMAQWIGENREYPAWIPFTQSLISKAGYERPPLWNILEASFFYIFGFSEFIVKILTPTISVMIGIVTYLFAKRFYKERIGFVAAVLLVTIPSFVTYSVLFYTDIIMTFFVIMFIFMFALSVKTGRRLYMLGAGTFGAFTYMTKLTGYVIYAFVALFFLYYFVKEKKFLSLIKKYFPLFLMLILIPSTFFIRNYAHYGTPICAELPFIGGIFYKFFDPSGCFVSDFEPQYDYAGRTEEAGTEANVFTMGITNYLHFAYGNIWFVVFAFFSGIILMFVEKMKEPEGFGIVDTILLLMLLLYIPIFLVSTKRAEDTARYSLVWAPIISIIGGKYFDSINNIRSHFLSLIIVLILLFINIWVLVYYFPMLITQLIGLIIKGLIGTVVFLSVLYFLIKENYKNALTVILISFILSMSFINSFNKAVGMAQVKQFSPLFFESCNWVKENLPKDSLLTTVWSYRAAYSCQRNAGGIGPDISLSKNTTYITSTAKKLGITHIFIQKFSIDYQNRHLSEQYDWEFIEFLENNPDHFENIFENGPSLDLCRQSGGCDGNIIYEIKY